MSDGVEREVAAIREAGFVVLPDLIPPGDLAGMRRALAPALDTELYGRNDFEGHRTQRVYSLVAVAPVFTALVEHPRVLALCDAFLERNYLLTASQAIRILPGETPQPFHTDDSFYRIARPRDAVSLSFIFAVDPFTVENGATQVVPGSHRWEDAAVERLLADIDFATVPDAQRIPRPTGARPAWLRGELLDVVMPAGAGIAFLGTLVHRGGENRSDRPRLALSNQYCQPWARQQENYCLSVPREQAAAMSPRVQGLLGYSVHPPFMGHANGLHPRRMLETSRQ
ncbi:MAG TPA: phytanoyl-CoA dioxygenase family protein [Candidatus Binatia bacterium]|nr:phytanoyl-CoA dioxygenase family protein [Candidatus Binatia bacterium]